MTQLSDDCFAFGGPLMSMQEALDRLMRGVAPLQEVQRLPLSAARGRVLAEDLAARLDAPPRDNAAVDGYALAHADLSFEGPTLLPVAGRAAAGHPLQGAPAPHSAVRVFTGAVLPEGTDTVVMQEDVEALDGDRVRIPPGLKPGANRRKAGEDMRRGAVVLRRGHRLRPQDIALAAAAGHASLPVQRPPNVAVFSSGDELREPGTPLAAGQIYDANRHMLLALLQGLGCPATDLGILPDQADGVRRALAEAAGTHDVLMTSGGMSTGEEDHMRDAVSALGRLHFWRLAVKPGRPVALGQVGNAAFVGLPGNPVAVMVCFVHFARPLLLRLSGANELLPRLYPVRAGFSHGKKAGRREWLRAALANGADGPVAEKFARQGSGILTSLVAADGLVELAEAVTEVREGDMVPFLPFSEVLA